MPKRIKLKAQDRGFVLFDVVYADGSRASNRRVPMDLLAGLDGDAPASSYVEEQDAEIARSSGREQRSIESISRSPRRPKTPS